MPGLLILDVDGVIYPDGAARPHQDRPGTGGWSDWRRAMRRPRHPAGGRVPLKLSRQMGEAIAQLCGDTGARIWWLTSWRAHAVDLVAPQLGVADHTDGYIDWPSSRTGDDHRDKAPALQGWLAERLLAGAPTGPVAWVDDELDQGGVLAATVASAGCPLRAAGVDGLRIGTDPRQGLTRAHLERIRGFLSGG